MVLDVVCGLLLGLWMLIWTGDLMGFDGSEVASQSGAEARSMFRFKLIATTTTVHYTIEAITNAITFYEP